MPSTRRSAMSRPGPRGSPSLERIRPREGERAGSSCEAAFSTVRVHVLQLPYLFDRVQGALPMNHSIIALAAALAASSALAAQDDYPPGLFENSPVVPSGPPNAVAPSQPPDAVDFSDPRTLSTRWTVIAKGSLRAPFAVWRRSSGRMPSAITLATSGRCGRPQRTSQTSEGTGTREPAVTGRAADAGERHRAGPAFLSRPPPTTPSARRCIWTRPLWPVHRWDGPNASSTSRRPSLTV